MRRGRHEEPKSPDFVPVRLDDVDIGGPLPRLSPANQAGDALFAKSMCLVRLHGKPLGMIEVELPARGLEPEVLAATIRAELELQIKRHLETDELPVRALDAGGLGQVDAPLCTSSRRELMKDAPHVTVVICTRDRPDMVRITLNSLLDGRYPSSRYEVVVVDNAAGGDAVTGLVDEEFNGDVSVRVVREPRPGLSHARNRGLEVASGEIVLFADDDVIIDRDWIAKLVAPFADPQVGATSGLTLPDVLETPTQRWVEGFGGRMTDFGERVFDMSDPPADRPLFPFTVGELGAGRNMAFRRSLLQELGGFDVALGPGTIAHDGDDIEALLRVLISGARIVNDPAAIVWHAHPREYRELQDRVWGYGAGLTACLTKAIIDHPRLLAALAIKLPRGIMFAFRGDSAKNVGRQDDYPRELILRELAGMACGPFAYLRSRIDQRRRVRKWASRAAETS